MSVHVFLVASERAADVGVWAGGPGRQGGTPGRINTMAATSHHGGLPCQAHNRAIRSQRATNKNVLAHAVHAYIPILFRAPHSATIAVRQAAQAWWGEELWLDQQMDGRTSLLLPAIAYCYYCAVRMCM